MALLCHAAFAAFPAAFAGVQEFSVLSREQANMVESYRAFLDREAHREAHREILHLDLGARLTSAPLFPSQ